MTLGEVYPLCVFVPLSLCVKNLCGSNCIVFIHQLPDSNTA